MVEPRQRFKQIAIGFAILVKQIYSGPDELLVLFRDVVLRGSSHSNVSLNCSLSTVMGSTNIKPSTSAALHS